MPGVCLPCQPQPAENIPYIEGEFPLRYLAVLALYPTEAGGMHKLPILKVPTSALCQFLSAKSLKSLSPRGSTQAWFPLSSLRAPPGPGGESRRATGTDGARCKHWSSSPASSCCLPGAASQSQTFLPFTVIFTSRGIQLTSCLQGIFFFFSGIECF